ncbi:MAG: biopolymer transporter ExbD [Bacteroidales bacterium]|nr:biopolymer transporter ExbD [Bacteroidales bacterium]MDZ4205401.1 biopolymer transporter ExbD [Bacteroidales bacterium]
MARFKRKGKGRLPGISTASLPDIIFMLLFFFMVTTVMRETTLIVKVKVPDATEVQKLERKSLVSYIYIGPPLRSQIFGTESRIQLNDRFASVSEIQNFIVAEREARDEADRGLLTASLKVDQETKMGIVTDVKQELRRIGAFRINYSTRRRIDK